MVVFSFSEANVVAAAVAGVVNASSLQVGLVSRTVEVSSGIVVLGGENKTREVLRRYSQARFSLHSSLIL